MILREFKSHRFLVLTFNLCFLLFTFTFFLSSCGPTYPKDSLVPSIVALCKKEYGVDASVQIAGKTLGVYLPLEKLLDSTLQIPLEARDKLDDVVLATSRAALSTDSPIDFYVVIAQDNLVKKIVGLNIFQVSVFVLYISMGKVKGATAPILIEGVTSHADYSNPLPSVLILTAIVVGVATIALGLALVVRIRDAYGTIEDDEITAEERDT